MLRIFRPLYALQPLQRSHIILRNFVYLAPAAMRCPQSDYQSRHHNPTSKARRCISTGVEPSMLSGLWQALSNSTPVAYMQYGLTEIHNITHLPWWASIVLSTILFRTIITLPLAIYQNKITSRIELIALEMPAIAEQLKWETAAAIKKFKWSEQQAKSAYQRSLKIQWNKLIVRENCHPAKMLIVLWGQIPLWICQSAALRNLVQMLPDPSSFDAQIIYTELTLGGFGWIPNLTEVDSSYILPVALGALNLGIIEIQSMLRTRPPTFLHKFTTNAFRVLSVVMVPVACTVPSALCIYWVASSTYGLAQNLLLVSPIVRRAVGIPLTKKELKSPYEHMWQTMKLRTGQIDNFEPLTEAPKKDIGKVKSNSEDSTIK